MIDLRQGDCLQILRQIPDQSVDLVIADPPYNIGVQTTVNNKKITNRWDKIDGYVDWFVQWINECTRVLKSNGVLYFWHNDMAQIAQLMEAIRTRTSLAFVSFCIWDKGDGYRAKSWKNRKPDGDSALRSWFNICEYCLHFFNAPADAEKAWRKTGLDRINSNPNCYRPIKDWYQSELVRLGISEKEIARKYTEVTGKKPYMLRHYFQDSQFAIPTKAVWESVYVPLGFGKEYESLRAEYESLRAEYESLRAEYESLRNVHNVDAMHCNIWHVPPIPSQNRYHTCQKPVELLSRLIRVSSREGATVLDPFMGSGSTGVACVQEGRNFIGIELDEKYVQIARERIEAEEQKRLE